MQIKTLQEFIELANCLSFSKAAERLYISQPALSNHIAELEKELGVTLINRNRPVKLTIVGTRFYGDACKIVEVCRSSVAACRKLEKESTRYHLTVKNAFGGSGERKHLLELVTAFKKERPSVEVHMVSGENVHLIDELKSGGIDCGIIPCVIDGSQEDDFIDYIFSASDRLGIWMSPNNDLAKKECLDVQDLQGRPYPLPSGAQYEELQKSAMDFFDSHGISPRYRFILVESFEEFLFCIDEDDVLLGVPEGKRGVAGALDEKVFRPFEPKVENKWFIAMRKGDDNPALTLFRNFIRQQTGFLQP